MLRRSILVCLAVLAAVLVVAPVAHTDTAPPAAVTGPSSGEPVVVGFGDPIALGLRADAPVTWSASYRTSGGGWARFPDAAGTVGTGEHALPLLAPGVAGLYDLRVEVAAADGATRELIEPGAILVTGPGLVASQHCDSLDDKRCLLPFPSDRFTAADPTTDTGRRINLNPLAMPRNAAGLPIIPTELNRNDGFSPGALLLTYVPGLDLWRTWGTADNGAIQPRHRDHITDISRSLAPDAPMVIINTRTGERHPFWSELDTHPDVADAQRLLMIRPAVNFDEGTRYVVALRNLVDTSGGLILSSPAFAAYRDGKPGTELLDTTFEARRPAMERIFADLAAAGVNRDELYLAWDFTIASERNLSERVLHMRDDAFALLGDRNLADGVIKGAPPVTAITEVIDFSAEQNRGSMRRVHGTVTVPNYLSLQVYDELEVPLNQLPDEVKDVVDTVEDELPGPLDSAVGLLTDDSLPVALPGSRLNTIDSPDGLPVRNPLQPDVEVPFTCEIARSSATTPSIPMLYGHGLLGGRGEVQGGSTEDLRRRGFTACAVDWWGMSLADLSNVAMLLVDNSNFASLPDRSQQGFVNFLYLGRALAHPDGLGANPAFQGAGGKRLITEGELVYDGNSQGGIMGGALAALAPDFTRAVLGVPGMNYSTLLNRSSDWEGSYAEVFYAAYPFAADRPIVYSLMQMLWDRAEGNGYAHHMSTDPYPNTPAHQILLQVAFADHQVANIAAEVEGRTIGATMHWPNLPAGLHWSADPAFGFKTAAADATPGASYFVYWYAADRGNKTPPNGNLPPHDGQDPHEDPRRDEAGADQSSHFLRTGELIDTCHGPCISTNETRNG